MIADDLFAGAGGWSLAAARLNIHDRGVENMLAARATRDAAGLTTIHDDVWTFRPDGKAAGEIASPPCPPWSQATKKRAGVDAFTDLERCVRSGAYLDLDRLHGFGAYMGDDRIALALTPLHFAMRGTYRWLAWEQVPAVLPVWELCAEILRDAGWHVWTGCLNAEQYGVPQTRTRAVLLASQDSVPVPPTPTHSRYYPRTPDRQDLGVLPWVSLAEALDYPTAERGRTYPDWCYRRPSTTIVGSFRPEVVAAPGYRTTVSRQNAPDSVTVSVAEAGVLQSFPPDHPWQGAKGKRFLQAGNAVPPGLAVHALASAAGIDVREVAA